MCYCLEEAAAVREMVEVKIRLQLHLLNEGG